jgi:hypothetical protein
MNKSIDEQIEEMANKMEKSSVEPKDKLFSLIKSLGQKGLQERLPLLSNDEKQVLKAALEELTLAKAVSFDKEAQGAKVIQGKVTDTIIQEEIASDDADEKLVKPEAAKMSHQGTKTDGWEGQVIKSNDKDEDDMKVSKKEMVKEHKELVNVLESDDKEDDKKEAKKQGKELKEMKKSEIEILEENLDEIVEKSMAKCNDSAMVSEKLEKKGLDKKKIQGAIEKFKGKVEKAEKKEKESKEEESKETPKHEAKESKKEEKKEEMKKSVSWQDENRLFKSNALGRNHSFNLEQFVNETLAKGETQEEPMKKSEGKEDLNDIIAKSLDQNWYQIGNEKQGLENAKAQNGSLVKSFDEVSELALILGLTPEEAKKILG